MASFDLKDLVAKVHFNYVGAPFPGFIKDDISKIVLPDLMGITDAIKSGKPYFTTVKLEHNGQKFEFPNEPLISLSLVKTIVETATVGKERKGTVKEYITTEDYQITLRGVCVDIEDPDRYPSDQVDAINKMFDVNDSLKVVNNKFLELFKIRNIVLKEKRFEEMAGQQGLQKYTISAVSDQDFYADLNEKQVNRKNVLS